MNVDKSPATVVRAGVGDEDAAIARSLRTLVRGVPKALLATINVQTGHPFASLITNGHGPWRAAGGSETADFADFFVLDTHGRTRALHWRVRMHPHIDGRHA